MYIAPANWIHVLLALCLMAIGLALVFDALFSSHAFEWPLGFFPGRRRHCGPATFPQTSEPTLCGSDRLSARAGTRSLAPTSVALAVPAILQTYRIELTHQGWEPHDARRVLCVLLLPLVHLIRPQPGNHDRIQ